MRKFAFGLFLLLGLAACNQDAAAPVDDRTAEFDEAISLVFDASFAGDPMHRFIPFVLRLPEHLKLTSEQEAQVKALIEAFKSATRADHEALATILRQAREARHAGKSADEIRAILQQGEPIRRRVVAAEQKLRADLLAILTAEQRAWIESQQPKRCDTVALTAEQRMEISGLFAAFEQANRADLDAIKSALERARAAHRDGVPREEVRAILAAVQPAMERIRAAQIQLAAEVLAVLTPEQIASGCYRPHLRRT